MEPPPKKRKTLKSLSSRITDDDEAAIDDEVVDDEAIDDEAVNSEAADGEAADDNPSDPDLGPALNNPKFSLEDERVSETPTIEEPRVLVKDAQRLHGSDLYSLPSSVETRSERVLETQLPIDDRFIQSSRSLRTESTRGSGRSQDSSLYDSRDPFLPSDSQARTQSYSGYSETDMGVGSVGSQRSQKEYLLGPYELGPNAAGVEEVADQPWSGPDWGHADDAFLAIREKDFQKWLVKENAQNGEENLEQYLEKRFGRMESLKKQRDDKPGRRDVALDQRKWDEYYKTTIDRPKPMLKLNFYHAN